MRSSCISPGFARIVIGIAVLTAAADGQATTRITVDSTGAEANDRCIRPRFSADGQIVTFYGNASNLVAGDTNSVDDVFVHDRATGITERVSVDSSGGQTWFGGSFESVLSADGQVVAFESDASTLVAGDTNHSRDVFVHDRRTGVTERVSVGASGAEANGFSGNAVLSADGQVVAFASYADNLVVGDTNGEEEIFIHDRSTGITERVSVDSSGFQANNSCWEPELSGDGQLVAFRSSADNLVTGDTNVEWDIFVHDRTTGITERVSVDSAGAQANDYCETPAISADGQFVAFRSYADNLVSGDTNLVTDVFVHDRSTGITERVSVDSSGGQANRESWDPRLSADGGVIVFTSDADNLVAGDKNLCSDTFVHDRRTGVTERVSVSSSGAEANLENGGRGISADGFVIGFSSDGDNLVPGDTNGVTDVFVRERCRIAATWSNYGAGFPGTNGVPSFTSRADPRLGTIFTLDLANSYGMLTPGVLFLGFSRTSIHSGWGGDLLVVPALTQILSLSPIGSSFTQYVPNGEAFYGLAVDLQAIELDPGALRGISFTEGLELVLGH